VRTLDPSFLTSVANHPEVRPYLKGNGLLDLTEIISNPSNIALQYNGGGWVLIQVSVGVYEVHSMFLPEFRGRHVAECLTDALEYVFIHTDCHRLVTQIPDDNKQAKALGKMAGFRPWFRRSESDYMRIELEDWAQSSESCKVAGEGFHNLLEAAKVDAGSRLESHDDDPAHDHAVGAAVLMCQSGNGAKAVWYYNAWAVCAGYAPIKLVSVNPLVIDVVDAVLEGPEMKVILCR